MVRKKPHEGNAQRRTVPPRNLQFATLIDEIGRRGQPCIALHRTAYNLTPHHTRWPSVRGHIGCRPRYSGPNL